MGNWDRKVEIKDLLNEDGDVTGAMVRSKSSEIVARFDSYMPLQYRSLELDECIEEFAELSNVTGDSDDEMVETFDDMLSNLYDACDRDRIWLGL